MDIQRRICARFVKMGILLPVSDYCTPHEVFEQCACEGIMSRTKLPSILMKSTLKLRRWLKDCTSSCATRRRQRSGQAQRRRVLEPFRAEDKDNFAMVSNLRHTPVAVLSTIQVMRSKLHPLDESRCAPTVEVVNPFRTGPPALCWSSAAYAKASD